MLTNHPSSFALFTVTFTFVLCQFYEMKILLSVLFLKEVIIEESVCDILTCFPTTEVFISFLVLTMR